MQEMNDLIKNFYKILLFKVLKECPKDTRYHFPLINAIDMRTFNCLNFQGIFSFRVWCLRHKGNGQP